MSVKKVVISLAITGHEEEAKTLSYEAEKAIRERFPLATIFNPTRLPKMHDWEDYMKVCRTRIAHWGDTLIRCESQYIAASRGAKEELELAEKCGLKVILFKDGKLEA